MVCSISAYVSRVVNAISVTPAFRVRLTFFRNVNSAFKNAIRASAFFNFSSEERGFSEGGPVLPFPQRSV